MRRKVRILFARHMLSYKVTRAEAWAELTNEGPSGIPRQIGPGELADLIRRVQLVRSPAAMRDRIGAAPERSAVWSPIGSDGVFRAPVRGMANKSAEAVANGM